MGLYIHEMIDRFSWSVAAVFFASTVYQYVVFEYTATDVARPFDDWHRSAILAVSGIASALAIYKLYCMLIKPPYAGQLQDTVMLLLCAAPSAILFSYEVQKQSAIQNAAIFDWRREFSHLYAGCSLLLMALSGIMAVPGIIQQLTAAK